jgi:Metallo-peptidase family M12B Reprolysin-like
MKKFLLVALSFVLISTIGFSQTDRFWSSHLTSNEKIITDKAVARSSFPKEFKLFDLKISDLRQQLFTIVGENPINHSTIISLPNADGNVEKFEVFEASNFEPALQARFTTIRAFSGKGITDKYSTLKLSISPQGIQTMIFRTDKENEFIEPYSRDHSVYAVFKSQRTKGTGSWKCTTPDEDLSASLNARVDGTASTARPESNSGELRVMRLAQSCNGEYAAFFGASTAGTAADQAIVLAAFNATLTRCNGVYEKDLALHLNLISNTTAVIFYNPATDPYSTVTPPNYTQLGDWNAQLQTTLTNIIGAANYDIGHMFGSVGGGGNAGCIGCVCGALKGSGITSPGDGIPQGDNFDIDYVVHEVGHQLGGTHTFSMGIEAGGLTNREVGSGITIMGYAGITNQDVAPHSIDIYHAVSIAQIQTNLSTKTCPVTTNISATNATPVVAPVANYTIPKSTPFMLTGSATDANAGDALTYCWEQNESANASVSGVNSVASPTKLVGPNFLSFSPVASSSRTFPRLSTILAGAQVTGPLPGGDAGANIEALSSVARTLNFTLTVRDNSPYVSTGAVKVGQTAFTDMTVTVDATSGPFQVTSPNSIVTYATCSNQTVTWDVNNTTAAPVSCANVKISYSSDGGLTFPIVLAASTANDGSEVVSMPSTATTTGRIKVESIGNIFFDISNTNFTLAAPALDFNFGPTVPTVTTCPAAATLTASIPTTATGGFANPITLATTTGVPAGTTVTFAAATVAPGSAMVATLNNANTLAYGTYTIGISGTATGTCVKNTTITFTINPGAAPVLTTVAPQSICTFPTATATFAVTTVTTPVTYQWQSAPTAVGTFTNVTTGTGGNTASYTTATTPLNGSVYRCIVTSQCGVSTSNVATLTVNPIAASTLNPRDTVVCTGIPASFTAAATGTNLVYQWEVATALAGPYTNVVGGTGATTTTYTTANTVAGDNGNYYRLKITSTTCVNTVFSAIPARLTVNTNATITTQPTLTPTVCVNSSNTISVVAAFATGYKWQISTAAVPAFTDIPSATNSTYTIPTALLTMTGNKYRVQVLSSCVTGASVFSNEITLNVINPITITQAPVSASGCANENYTFSVVAAIAGLPTYQWQTGPTATGPFTNLVGSGANTPSYTINNASVLLNGTYYRVRMIGSCADSTTAPVQLLLSNRPSVVLTLPATSNTNPNVNNVITTTVSPVGNYIYNWKKNGNVIPNTLATTSIAIPVDDNGTYTVSITDPTTGCTSAISANSTITTNPLTSDNLALGKVFVYPNPVSTIMYVRFNTSTSATRGTMLNVYDERGARAFSKEYAITGTLGRMAVDMSKLQLGTYMVYIMDANGKKLAGTKVVKIQ